ncbi:MAG: sigma-70 family RNA polymerase sigma factor [candidate division Zixibacteria bacterium]|nr:sigma-70 family RNA polymerase sigma factor [candidate division Zixibacteria bacterium]
MADQKQKELRKRFEAEAMIHIDALMRTARRMTRNEDEAEDLVQEAMLKSYRFFEKFEQGTNCKAWLFKIMTNIFINNYRSKAKAPQSLAFDDIDDSFLFGQLAKTKNVSDPEAEFFSKIFDDDVKNAINLLPEDFRIVVMLSFIEGFAYQEIADITNLQIGTVKSRLHRGRKLLQKNLWDYALKNGYVKEPQN